MTGLCIDIQTTIQIIFDSHGKAKGIRGQVDGKEVTLDCQVVVCASPRGIDDALVRYLHEAAIVFNGRIIVDRDFRTNDESILAGLHKSHQLLLLLLQTILSW